MSKNLELMSDDEIISEEFNLKSEIKNLPKGTLPKNPQYQHLTNRLESVIKERESRGL